MVRKAIQMRKKSRIRETLYLLTDADRSTDTKKTTRITFLKKKKRMHILFENYVIAGQY